MKVRFAAVNLEGKALQWHQIYMKSRLTREPPSWEEYIRELSARFGNYLYDDPMGELMNLKQIGTVQEYHDQFEELLNRVVLPEDYATSCFLGGLRPEIQLAVRMFIPKTVAHASGLAKIEEARLSMQRNGKFSSRNVSSFLDTTSALSNHGRNNNTLSTAGYQWKRDTRPLLPTPSLPALPHVEKHKELAGRRPFKKLSKTEMDEKRAKGLCFWCDEKFGMGHKCANKQFFKLEVWDDNINEDGEEEVEALDEGGIDEEGCGGNLAHISFNAMTSMAVPTFRTMRITGHVGKQTINIFIDCGSSHNFIHPSVIQKLGLKVQRVKPLTVEVADGNKLTTNELCSNFKWKMQGQEFKTELLVLPVGGCEVVLGMQWLTTIGDVKWNFGELRMEFLQNDKKVVLRGMKQHGLQLVKRKKMQQILQKPQQVASAQLCLIRLLGEPAMEQEAELLAVRTTSDKEEVCDQSALSKLLSEYEELFQEPTELPPRRLHDHKIPLKPDTQPINVRPYRYPTIQKGEIEKLVVEMLKGGIIRPSSSPFSSPVVLVKKMDHGECVLIIDN